MGHRVPYQQTFHRLHSHQEAQMYSKNRFWQQEKLFVRSLCCYMPTTLYLIFLVSAKKCEKREEIKKLNVNKRLRQRDGRGGR